MPDERDHRRLDVPPGATGANPAPAGPSPPGRPPAAVAMALIVVVVIAALVAIALARPRNATGTSAAQVATSTDPTRFVLPRLQGGGTVRLADFRGRPAVVNFFASSCPACRGEAPGFVHANADLHGTVAFVGVDSRENGDGMAFAHELGYDRFTLARDIDGEQDSGLHDALVRSNKYMPITAFYSAAGKLLYVATGALPEDVLRSRIHDLFGAR